MKSNLKSYLKHPSSLAMMILVKLAAFITFTALLFLLGYILVNGVPHLKLSLFEWKYNSTNVSLMPALINTIVIVFISLVVSVPIGVFSAIYLCEYAIKGNRIIALIRTTTETLSGIPSIVYGLFGMLFFVIFLGWGYSVLAGSMTLSIMILPLIMRTAEEALQMVPTGYREASYALGAGKLRTIFKIVLPAAVSGIISGVILSTGRIVGETAALIYTAGTVARGPSGSDFLFNSGRTLAVHLYTLSSEGFNTNEAFATAVVLLAIVLTINSLSSIIAKLFSKG